MELGTRAIVSMIVRTILAVLAFGIWVNSGRRSVSSCLSAAASSCFAYRSPSFWMACAPAASSLELEQFLCAGACRDRSLRACSRLL